MSRLAIVGGGAAGFFLAVNVKEMLSSLEVDIYERQHRVLAKVAISGGGRCNCTNSFAGVTDLRQVYPRGAKLLERLFKHFGPRDAYQWFEDHGVPLVTQDDQCVFPAAQDSRAIIDCFMRHARRKGVRLFLGQKVDNPESLLDSYDYVAVTTGGSPHAEGCVPSLFAFLVHDKNLTDLTGMVVENALLTIPSTKFRASGPLLVTHWGLSGPAVLTLSGRAARHLAECRYASPLLVNWTGESDANKVRACLSELINGNPQKTIDHIRPYALPSRLWNYLLHKTQLSERRSAELGKRGLDKLTNALTNDTCQIVGRSPHKSEFVTCGGIPLDSVDKATLASKRQPRLFYAGEVLDIDGITGGFNFQAAWTTAYTVATAIKKAEVLSVVNSREV